MVFSIFKVEKARKIKVMGKIKMRESISKGGTSFALQSF